MLQLSFIPTLKVNVVLPVRMVSGEILLHEPASLATRVHQVHLLAKLVQQGQVVPVLVAMKALSSMEVNVLILVPMDTGTTNQHRFVNHATIIQVEVLSKHVLHVPDLKAPIA